MVKKNACVFISGQGSNLKNLIQRSRDVNFPINIKLIISDNKKAFGIIFLTEAMKVALVAPTTYISLSELFQS